MASKFLTVFLLLALVALVSAQNATNEIDECIKRENCAANDRECRAACAGVPDPDPQVAVDTQTCYKKCADDHLPKDEPAYKDCTKDCREKVYQEGVTEPGSSAPSKSAQKDNGDGSAANGDSGSGSKDSGSEGDDGNSTDGNGSDGKDNSTDESGASFSAKSAHVYVFAAVLACVAFTVGL